jgi:hypothetical protein
MRKRRKKNKIMKNYIYTDSPINYSKSFQDPASQWKLGIIRLHDFIIFYLIIILTVVLWT